MSWEYVGNRLLLGVFQLAGLAVLIFLATELLPGDAARTRFGEFYTDAQAAELRAQLQLDEPALSRMLGWLGDIITGDLGDSLISGEPVAGMLLDAAAPTLTLAIVTLAILVPLGTLLGFVAAIREGGPLDRTLTVIMLALHAVPDFALALLLVALLSLQLGLLPPTAIGADSWGMLADPRLLVIPVLVLLCRVLAGLSRQVRAGTIDVLSSEYVAQASRLGVPRRRLLIRHVAPNAAAPAVQQLARTGDGLIGGVLVVEAVFAVPGLATLLIDGVTSRDVPVVQGVTLVLGAVTLVINLIADLVGHRLVPRAEVLR